MKITSEYKGKQVTFDFPDEKLEELVKEQKKTGWEKPPKNGSVYYFVNQHGKVESDSNLGLGYSAKCYERGNYFTSKELAENIARYQFLDLRIRRRIAEICEPVSKHCGVDYYFIVYDRSRQIVDIDRFSGFSFGGWYCDTEEHAAQIIEEFKDELTWYFTEFKDRMDV